MRGPRIYSRKPRIYASRKHAGKLCLSATAFRWTHKSIVVVDVLATMHKKMGHVGQFFSILHSLAWEYIYQYSLTKESQFNLNAKSKTTNTKSPLMHLLRNIHCVTENILLRTGRKQMGQTETIFRIYF